MAPTPWKDWAASHGEAPEVWGGCAEPIGFRPIPLDIPRESVPEGATAIQGKDPPGAVPG